MPGLLRGIARTAVVAGTATAVSNRVSRRQAGRWATKGQRQAEPEYEDEQEPADAPQADDPGDAMSQRLAQLKDLAELKSQGVLTDAEFEAQKQQILG
jgi:hypothetical protein